jgi:predicted TIM-barrel fold metal-dependent hydrolase
VAPLLIVALVAAPEILVCRRPAGEEPRTVRAPADAALGPSDLRGPCLVDAHAHYPGSELSRLLDASDEAGIVELVMFFRPPHLGDPAIEHAWLPITRVLTLVDAPRDRDPEALLERFDGALATGAFRGFGEILLRHRRIPTPFNDEPHACSDYFLDLYAVAAAHGAPITIHLEHSFAADHDGVEEPYSPELECALSAAPHVNFIWAHSGDAPPERVAELLARHPNLYADLACRHPFFARGLPLERQSLTVLFGPDAGRLTPEWKRALESFPDRFLVGLDAGSPDRIVIVDALAEYYRGVLAQLPLDAAEKIAGDNLRALLPR